MDKIPESNFDRASSSVIFYVRKFDAHATADFETPISLPSQVIRVTFLLSLFGKSSLVAGEAPAFGAYLETKGKSIIIQNYSLNLPLRPIHSKWGKVALQQQPCLLHSMSTQ